VLRQAGGIRRGRKQAVGTGCPTTVLRTGGWGPKMRHLVLYKLAGFFHADKTPCACFFPGAMLVGKSQKNTVFKKKVCFFGPKTPLFGLFVHFFAQIRTLGGTSVHFRKIAKMCKLPNLHVCTRVHISALPRAHKFLCARKKNIFFLTKRF
jgi:hypothetical protein